MNYPAADGRWLSSQVNPSTVSITLEEADQIAGGQGEFHKLCSKTSASRLVIQNGGIARLRYGGSLGISNGKPWIMGAPEAIYKTEQALKKGESRLLLCHLEAERKTRSKELRRIGFAHEQARRRAAQDA